jgi:hypothetical protein
MFSLVLVVTMEITIIQYVSTYILGDSKWLWMDVAAIYENVCGELTFHMRAFDFFIPLQIDLTFVKITCLWTAKKCQLYPTYRTATCIFVHSCHVYPEPFWITNYFLYIEICLNCKKIIITLGTQKIRSILWRKPLKHVPVLLTSQVL